MKMSLYLSFVCALVFGGLGLEAHAAPPQQKKAKKLHFVLGKKTTGKLVRPTPIKLRPMRPKFPYVRLFMKARDVQDRGKVFLYAPHSRARRKHYVRYTFDKKHFLKKMGPLAKLPFGPAVVKVISTKKSSSKQPVGRIFFTTHHCKIIHAPKRTRNAMPGPSRPSGFAPRKLTLTLSKRGLSENKGLVRWNPYAGVRRAYYTIYTFKRTEFIAKVGDVSKIKMAQIRVLLVSRSRKSHQVPVGTIHTTTYHCKILRGPKAPKKMTAIYRLPKERFALKKGSLAFIQLKKNQIRPSSSKWVRIYLGNNLPPLKPAGKKFRRKRFFRRATGFYFLLLAKADFKKHFPKGNGQGSSLLVKITKTQFTRVKPKHPGARSPLGGYAHHLLHARILRVETRAKAK